MTLNSLTLRFLAFWNRLPSWARKTYWALVLVSLAWNFARVVSVLAVVAERTRHCGCP